MNGLIFMPFFRRDDMDIVYKASDPLDEFYRICDEQGEERRLEARRKLYEEKDLNCFIVSIMKSVQVVCIESVP